MSAIQSVSKVTDLTADQDGALDGVEEANTVVIFTSDNGPEATWPCRDRRAVARLLFHPHGGLPPGALHRQLARPCPAGCVSNEIVHESTASRLSRGLQARNTWLTGPAMKILADFEASLKKYPPIAPGAPDPYTSPLR